ncbi:MAG: glycosyltransferase family 39 protein [Candidatus Aenigmatarchaeota archaeon]
MVANKIKFNFFSNELKIFLTFFMFYTIFANWPGMREYSVFFLTKAIVDENRLEIDSYYNQTSDRAFYNGKHYSDKEPGLSFLATPIYAIWKFFYYNFFPKDFIELNKGSNEYIVQFVHNKAPIYYYLNPGVFELTGMFLVTVFTSSFFSSLSVVLIYKLSQFLTKDEKRRFLLTIIYGFASPIFHASLIFVSHAVATFLLLLSFYYLLFFVKRKKIIYIVISGILAGFSFTLELLSLVVSCLFLFYLFFLRRKYREAIIFLLFFLFGSSPFFIYNFIIFGNPIDLPRNHLDSEVWLPLPGRNGIIISFSYNLNVMFRLLFDPYRGLFFYFPILLFYFPGLYLMYKKYPSESVLTFLIFLSVLFVSSMWWAWWHGGSFGPRLLTIISPFIVIPIIFSLELDYFKPLLFFFLIVSILNNFAGLTNAYEDALKDISNSFMLKEYKEKFEKFEILEDPLRKFYYPYFFRCGPNSKVLDSIIEKKYIDIRASSNTTCPRPFLSIFFVLLFVSLIWLKEIESFVKSKFKVSRKIFLHAFIFFFIFIFLNFLLVSIDVLFYPFDTDVTESYLLLPAIRLLNGKPLYNDIHSLHHFSSFKYPPIFPIINYFTLLILGKNLLSARIIVFISTLFVGFFVFLITKKIVKDFELSLFSTLLFFSSYVIFQMGTQVRADMLAMLFSIVGIYFFINYKKGKNLFFSTIFSFLALFTKQNFIAAPLSMFFYLLINDKKNCIKFLIHFSLLTFIITFLTNFLTNGQFILHVFYYAKGIIIFSLNDLIFLLKDRLINSSIFIFLGLIYFVRNKNNIVSIWFLTSLILTIFQFIREGSWINYLIEITAITPIIISSLLKQSNKKEEFYFILLAVLFQLLLFIDFDKRILFYVFNPKDFTPFINLQTDLKILKYVENSEGNVLVEHVSYLILTEKEISPEIWSCYELQNINVVSEEEVFNHLLSQNYSLVIYYRRLPLIKKFFEYVKNNYILIDELPWIDQAFHENIWYVYKKI